MLEQTLNSKLLAICVLVIGGAVLLSGLSMRAVAIDCNPDGPLATTVCDPAGSSNHYATPGLNLNCTPSGSNCVPGAGSRCGDFDGFEYAEAGACVHTIPIRPYAYCTDEYSKTWVPLRYVYGACTFEEGSCACRVYVNQSFDTQYSEVCDCFGTLL